MKVNENGLFTIKLKNKSTKRKYWNLVNKESLNSSIQFIKQGNAKGPKEKFKALGGKRAVYYYFQAGEASPTPIQVEFVYQKKWRKKITDFKKIVYEITIIKEIPKEIRTLEVKPEESFNITLTKSIIDNTHFWNLKNFDQLKNSVITFVNKDEGRNYRKKFWRTQVPAKPEVVVTFKAGTASNESVSIDFAEYDTDIHTYKKAITYIIKVLH